MNHFFIRFCQIFTFCLLLTTGGSAFSYENPGEGPQHPIGSKNEVVASEEALDDDNDSQARGDNAERDLENEDKLDDIDDDESGTQEESASEQNVDAEKNSGDVEKERTVREERASNEIEELAEEPGKIVLDDGIERLRRPVDRLVEQTLGSTSRPVGFDWRGTWAQFGITGSELLERNNFGSFRVGFMGRKAFGDVMVELAANYVYVFGTESSRLLALTPYIQPGRPSRLEFDVNVSYPIVEGVVTPFFNFFPPMEMVFSATAGARYLLYPKAVIGRRDWEKIDTWTDTSTWRDVGLTLATPQLTEEDRLALEREVLGGMMLDPGRIQTLVGFSFDIYMQPGLFVSTKALLAVPALLTVSGTRLGFWPELSLALGYAF